MATISDVGPPSLSSLASDDLHRFIQQMRARRILRPEPKSRAPARAKPARALSEDQLLNLIASNPALVAKLLGGAK